MKHKVLIVEDQDELRQLVRMTLECAGLDLQEAHDAAHALELLGPIWPDMVVLDIMMPGAIDGLELCEIIKHRSDLKHIKVLLLSAMGQRADIERGRNAGADAYLVKPFSPLELLETTGRLLNDGEKNLFTK